MFSGTTMPWKTSMKKKYVSLWIQNILVGVRKGMLYWQSCKKATIAASTLIREAFENTYMSLFFVKRKVENLPGKKCFLLGIAQISSHPKLGRQVPFFSRKSKIICRVWSPDFQVYGFDFFASLCSSSAGQARPR